MRYVYNVDKSIFEPYEFDLGSTNRQLQGWAQGVTSQEAKSRADLLGANIIKVNVPTIPKAIIEE
jgi:cation-transporting ATPase 13A3/4/5